MDLQVYFYLGRGIETHASFTSWYRHLKDFNMGRYILNSLTLAQVGIRLLPEETVDLAVELETGITEDLEQSQSTLLLTNKRLIRYSVFHHKASVVSSTLDDVDSIEVTRSQGNRQWIGVGFVFMLGGLALEMSALILSTAILSASLMAFALFLTGVVFVLSYIGGSAGEVVVRAGSKDIKSRMRKQALDDMGLFVQRAYALKMGYSTGLVEAYNRETEQDVIGDQHADMSAVDTSALVNDHSAG